MSYKAIKHTKEVIINFLQMYINNVQNYEHLLPPQIPEDHFLQTIVYDTEPEQLRTFPIIIVTNGSGGLVTSGLGDMAHELYDSRNGELLGYRYGGIYNFQLTIEIGCRSTPDREFLTDLITRTLRFNARRKMEAEGVLVTDVRYGGESVVNYDSNHIYVSTINISTWSEWYDDITLLPVEKVNIDFKEK